MSQQNTEEQQIPTQEQTQEKKQRKPKEPKQPKQPKQKQPQVKKEKENEGLDVKKSENFGEWYSQLITKAELLDYYDISGCYILRPNAFFIWEQIQKFFDAKIKKLGVKNCMFPMFVTKRALETEKDHVEGFSPEVAWVTKCGSSDMEEPIAIRPTSETIMYPSYAKWIKSHRDLPLRLNQWTNVVRWEFKHAVPFIRSREFYWQEGHSAFANKEEADEEVLAILNEYANIYEQLLAVPVIKGKKTENEKFAGADYTTTVEAFIPANGRAVQGGTSHHLGQNFSRMFGIKFEDKNKETQLAYQNSWGFTTRSIGVMLMVHSDDKGLVLPPRVASTQVVVIPLYFKDKDNTALVEKAKEVVSELEKAGIRVELDDRLERTPGWKYNYWELRGIPLRIEVGPKDLEKNQLMLCRRDTGEKFTMALNEFSGSSIQNVLDKIHDSMLERAREERTKRLVFTRTWEEFIKELNSGNLCYIPWYESKAAEEYIKEQSKLQSVQSLSDSNSGLTGAAKSLCIPLDQSSFPSLEGLSTFYPEESDKKPTCWCLFGRSY
ncbi:hypothetical protein ABK040_007904 [Willaertia magna]